MEQYYWRHLGVRVPADWELLSYQTTPAAGACTWADRTQHRLQLHWQAVTGAPDLARMQADLRAALATDPALTVTGIPDARWPGLEIVGPAGRTSRRGTYLPAVGCYLELVFLWPGARDAALEARVTRGVTAAPPVDGVQHWRAFGLDLTLDATRVLRRCEVYPGRAVWSFGPATPVTGSTVIATRLGLVAHWLHEPLAAWLRRQTPPGWTLAATTTQTTAGHTAVTLTGHRPAPGLARLRGTTRRYAATAWQCPTDGRVYALQGEYLSPAGPGPRLRCCAAYEGTL